MESQFPPGELEREPKTHEEGETSFTGPVHMAGIRDETSPQVPLHEDLTMRLGPDEAVVSALQRDTSGRLQHPVEDSR